MKLFVFLNQNKELQVTVVPHVTQNQPTVKNIQSRQGILQWCLVLVMPLLTKTQKSMAPDKPRLPSCEQVLRCFMYHIEDGSRENRTKWQSAKLVMSKVAVFYQKANIPMIAERKVCQRMISLLEENAKIRAIPVNWRSSEASLSKVKAIEAKLRTTFRLWPVNAERLMRNQEDIQFLQSMKSDRQASFGCFDKTLADKVRRRQARIEMEAQRRKKAKQELVLQTSVSSSHIDEGSGDSSDSSSDVDILPPSTTMPKSGTGRRKSLTGTSAFIPHDILKRPNLVSLATRLKMTPAQQAAYTEAVVAESGGELSRISSSYSTADRSRRKVGSTIAETCKQQRVAPKFATLHWDSKLLPTLSNAVVSEERLTVVVGNSHELKLLGVSSYKSGSDRKCGDIIADLTSDLLVSWKCADNIVNMTFDTTASNTGSVTAACVSIQQKLGKALLWSACRHHVGEIILTHVFQHLQIETSKSPEVTLFSRFRKHFDLPPHTTDQPMSKLDPGFFTGAAKDVVTVLKGEVLQKAQTELSIRRDDYLEFIELCMMFLDGVEEGKVITFKRPGALHKARWMAKLLYSIKICLLEQHIAILPPGTVTTKRQVAKIRDFVNFATVIYSSWWMSCNSAVDAPWHDLKLICSLLQYNAVNSTVASSALSAFKNHLWYLTAEMVPLSLFSQLVPATERRELADRLLAIEPSTAPAKPVKRLGSGFGKPVFPSEITESTKLADLIGPDSWYTIHILEIDMSFFAEDVESWPGNRAYETSMANVLTVNVINDCAERGVKLSSDFLSSARSEEHYQNVLQVVEHDRKRQPDLRKKTELIRSIFGFQCSC